MITVIVSMIVSAATTAGLYYVLHRANPTATQVVIDSAVSQAKMDVATAEAAVVAEVKKV